jgi:hypothetical protein
LPLNQQQLFPSFYSLSAPDNDIKAEIIRAVKNVREFAKFEVIILNKGEQDGLKLGNVLQVKRTSPEVIETKSGPIYRQDAPRFTRNQYHDGMLIPQENIGEVLVFKLYPEVSFAMVLGSEKPLKTTDQLTSP